VMSPKKKKRRRLNNPPLHRFGLCKARHPLARLLPPRACFFTKKR